MMTDPVATKTDAPVVPVVDASRPWLGLLPFSAATSAFFFGRDAEIASILERIEENTLTILFSQSGLGKSSLLGGGVIPRLGQGRKSPVLWRLDHGPLSPSLLDQTRDALLRTLPGLPWPPEAADISLWELVHRLPPLMPEDTPQPVLIFDQFEEIFTLGRQDEEHEARVEAWWEQMADLIQDRPPKALESRFAENRSLSRDYDFGRTPIRFVFSMREDYLSHLEGRKAELPLLAQNRMQLFPLDGQQALEAVLGPASFGDPPLVSREVAASIIRTVARVPSDTPLLKIRAVPPLLSLLCEQLNSARLAAGAAQIDASMVSERSEDILHHFYEDSFAEFDDAHREKIREIIEDRMVTVGGHRHPVAREDAEEELGARGVPQPKEVFDSLIRRRLLTAEEQGGVPRLEITHDVLLPLLIRSRKERRERVAREAQERRIAAEALKTRKRRILTGIMAVLTTIALAGAAFGWYSSREAIRQRDDARYNEGLSWILRAEVAEERGKQYPGTLLYVARAIGFDGVGRPEGREEPIRLITKENRGKGYDEYEAANKWLSQRPAYLPVWSSAVGGPPATALSFSPVGRHLAVGYQDGSMRLWDLSSDKDSSLLSTGSTELNDIAFQPDGKQLVIARNAGVEQWDTASLAFSPLDPVPASALAYSPDGQILAVASNGGELRLWNEGKESVLPTGQNIPASRIAFSADNSVVALAIPGVGVQVFFPLVGEASSAWTEAARKKPGTAAQTDAAVCPPQDVTAVAISSDGIRLAIGSENGCISIWDVASATQQSEVPLEQRHRGEVRDLCFRPDGSQLASAGGDGLVKLWDLTQAVPAITATLTGHTAPVTRVRYAPGSDLLASASMDGSAKLWDVSGRIGSAPDLYKYFEDGWYLLESRTDTKPPGWGGSTGFINLPGSSVIGLWRQPAGGPLVFKHLRDDRDWMGAIQVMHELPQAARSPMAAELAAALVDDAQKAAANSRWNLVDLRLRQLEKVGETQLPEAGALRKERQALAREGESFKNGEGLDLVWCDAATVTLGKSSAQESDRPGEEPYTITLSHGFWIGAFEVTQAQWVSVMGQPNPSRHPQAGATAPVEDISWIRALEFCRKLSDRERARGTLPAGWEYSLPTKAQWEYACRAGARTVYNYGDDPSELYRHANFKDASSEYPGRDMSQNDGQKITAPVGSYSPNAWKLYDMHGNVAEWCLDASDASDTGAPSNSAGKIPERLDGQIDPLVTEGKNRVFRGGSWMELPSECRSAFGRGAQPGTTKPDIGMRAVLVPAKKNK